MSNIKSTADRSNSNETLHDEKSEQSTDIERSTEVQGAKGECTNDKVGEVVDQSQPTVSKTVTADRPWSTFTSRQKALIVLVATLGACFSPFTANIYLPAIDTISQALHVSVSEVNLSITTYMIFQAIAPSIISAISDEYGRRPAYALGSAVYMVANLGLGLNNSYAGLLVLRCVQSAGSSGMVTLATGTIADVITSAERGKYISITGIASVLAPSVAPIVGGALAQHLGWHSIFWGLLIASVAYFVPLILFFPETGRKVVGDGSIPPPKWNRCITDIMRAKKATPQDLETKPDKPAIPMHSRLNFLATLSIVRDPVTAMLLFNISINYAAFYAINTSLTVQFGRIYHLDSTTQGLLFLPQAVGSLCATLWNIKFVDRWYKRHADRAGVPTDRKRQVNFLTSKMPIERARIELAVPMMAIMAVLMIVYGWLLQAKVSIAGPIVMLCFLGFTAMSSFSCLSTLVIDLHRSRPATASAASNLTRCLFGAGASAVVNPMINAMGNGWTFTVVGLISLAALPLLVLCAVRGQKFREKRLARETRKAEKAKAENTSKM